MRDRPLFVASPSTLPHFQEEQEAYVRHRRESLREGRTITRVVNRTLFRVNYHSAQPVDLLITDAE